MTGQGTATEETMEILLANPRGFCAGVDRAIEIVERALEVFGAPIYVRHDIVHNTRVVRELTERGAVFVEEVDEIPPGAVAIFSAHGVSQAVRRAADERGLRVFDATCPLVTKVHIEVAQHLKHGRDCVLIGHQGHPEVDGTMGQIASEAEAGRLHLVEKPEDVPALEVADPEQVAYVTQTTLSVDDTRHVIDALQARFPAIIAPRKDDICYATQNRQDAVKELAEQADVILVVGSPNSSNSNRLREIAQKRGCPAHLLDDPKQLERGWFEGVRRIGLTAGASAPESLVHEIIDALRSWGARPPAELAGREETIVFHLPRELRPASA